MEDLKPLGLDMSRRLIAALGGRDGIDGYGKGVIVGEAGELEHGALWHVPGGYAMRELLGESRPSSRPPRRSGASAPPSTSPSATSTPPTSAATSTPWRSASPTRPRAGEIVFVLAMTNGPRVHARMGGLAASEIKALDGLR